MMTPQQRRDVDIECSRVRRIASSLWDLVQSDMPEDCDFSQAGEIDGMPDWRWCRNEAHDILDTAAAIVEAGEEAAPVLQALGALDERLRVLGDRAEETLARMGGRRPDRFDHAGAVADLARAEDALRQTLTTVALQVHRQEDIALSLPAREDWPHADAELLEEAVDANRRAALRVDYVYAEAMRALGTIAAAHSKAALARPGSYLSGQLQQDADNADSEVFHLTGRDLLGRPGTGDGTGSLGELERILAGAEEAVANLRSSMSAEV